MLNHRPEQQGLWFAYNGWRYKDYYHILMKNGTLHKEMYPNADSWYANDGSGLRVEDKDVAFVKLLTDDEVHAYAFTGEDRITRNLNMFGDSVPAENCPHVIFEET